MVNMSSGFSRRQILSTALGAAFPLEVAGYIKEQREHFSYDEKSLGLPVGSMVSYAEDGSNHPHLVWVDDTSQAGFEDIDTPYFLAWYQDSETWAELPDRNPDQVIPLEEGAEIEYNDNHLTVESAEIDDAETDMLERYLGDENTSIEFSEEIQRLDDEIVAREDF